MFHVKHSIFRLYYSILDHGVHFPLLKPYKSLSCHCATVVPATPMWISARLHRTPIEYLLCILMSILCKNTLEKVHKNNVTSPTNRMVEPFVGLCIRLCIYAFLMHIMHFPCQIIHVFSLNCMTIPQPQCLCGFAGLLILIKNQSYNIVIYKKYYNIFVF